MHVQYALIRKIYEKDTRTRTEIDYYVNMIKSNMNAGIQNKV